MLHIIGHWQMGGNGIGFSGGDFIGGGVVVVATIAL